MVELKGQPLKIRNLTKTGRGRVVPLLSETVNPLRAHKARRNEECLKLEGLWHDEDIVFPNSRGEPMARANLINRHYKPILERTDLTRETRLYDRGHTFATLWVETGEGIEMLSGVLGHARISATSDRYVHPSDKARQDVMLRFGKRLSGGR